MSPDKQKQLQALCPSLFSDLDGCEPMAMFGFECGDGWHGVLAELILAIGKVCETAHVLTKATQVKEKFGGLRFYIDGGNDDIHALIKQAEAASFVTCEECGKAGELADERGWLRVCCDDCRTR
jgi:hypothetical protein